MQIALKTKADEYRARKPKLRFPSNRMWIGFIKNIDKDAYINHKKWCIIFSDGSEHSFQNHKRNSANKWTRYT
jgi:hypothetical protein